MHKLGVISYVMPFFFKNIFICSYIEEILYVFETIHSHDLLFIAYLHKIAGNIFKIIYHPSQIIIIKCRIDHFTLMSMIFPNRGE